MTALLESPRQSSLPAAHGALPAAHGAWGGWEPGTTASVLVAASHGTASPAGQAAIAGLVAAVAAARPEIAVVPAFVDVQSPAVDTVLAEVEAEARIVPLLLSAGYHTRHDLAGAAAQRPGTTVGRPLGPDPRLAAVLERRLRESGLRRGDRVVLACAGSTDLAGVRDCQAMARMLSERLGTGVEAAYVSAASPTLAEAVAREASAPSAPRTLGQALRQSLGSGWLSRRPSRTVVATYLLAPGFFASRVAGCGADVVTAPLLVPGAEVPAELVELVLERFDRL
jgi:sirohydrochlorin ferrochelatase